MQPQPAAADAGKDHEWWGGYGWGGAWGGYGGWECCGWGGLGGWGGVWGWWTLTLPSDVNQLLHTWNV
ncbi:hypothetical protein PsorP6_012994 [Peronosclerospora sorghi]|uniref:Uncharacterized protein n=1 Tax=Peronosclerospora sorghi TaxID=230839 RepID=A0ACC0WJW7_9STRA|nr:hypothetical protein PsorP6_012994 [Peronosclerospora sorghi]